MKNKSILILGVSSFVGSNLAEFFKKDYKVFGTYFNNKVEIPGVFTFPCDISKSEQLQTCFQVSKPDIVIYCAGVPSVFGCHEDSKEAVKLNANALYFVTENCLKHSSKIIYISSSLVFSGEKELYGEIDIPDYSTELGKTKSSGEYFLETSAQDYLIFRCCQLYGRGIVWQRPNFFQQLEKQIEINCDDNISMGFLDINYLSMVISLSIGSDLRNLLLHVSSTNLFTKFQFANQYAKLFQVDPSFIKKTLLELPVLSEKSVKKDQKLKFNLSTKNLENYLNITFPTIEESLEVTYKRFNGRNFE